MGWFRPSSRGGNLDPPLGWAGIPDVNHVHAGDRLQGNSFAKFISSAPNGSMGIEFFRGERLKNLTGFEKPPGLGRRL